MLGTTGPATEFNILEGLWNARVTSHVPMARVPSLLTVDGIVNALELTTAALRAAGFDPPRIARRGAQSACRRRRQFRPRGNRRHRAGGGSRRRHGASAPKGPFPADTVFVRARRGDFDAVLTMYHDQGQIAMKLMGFDRGVTLLGGFPFPICTPAHGTAYDIAGRGIANLGATRAAVLLAAEMARRVERRYRPAQR